MSGNKLMVICLLIFCAAGAYSQQPERKVVSSPAPIYSAPARAVGASGEVEVLVAINPEGEVVFAFSLSGHPLLKQLSREGAMRWHFEKETDSAATRSLTIVFSYGSGERIIEKSEKPAEEVAENDLVPPFLLNVRIVTRVPKLLLLPRENGVIKPEICELHEEEMETEILTVSRDGESEGENYSEDYYEARRENFPNANEIYYGYQLNKGTEKAEVHYCKTCRLRREQWVQVHKIN